MKNNSRILLKVKLTCIFTCVLFLISCQDEIKPGDSWYERFSNIDKFNEYIANNRETVVITNKIAKKFKLEGLKAKKVTISNCNFQSIKLFNSLIDTLIIKDSELNETSFLGSTIGNLSIDSTKLNQFRCKRCSIENFLLSNSDMRKSSITILNGQNTAIKNSSVFSSHFFDSESKSFQILNTKFDQDRTNAFARLKSDLLFVKNSTLNTDFYESQIKKVVIENVKGSYAGFLRFQGNEIIITDSQISFFNVGPINKPQNLLLAEIPVIMNGWCFWERELII